MQRGRVSVVLSDEVKRIGLSAFRSVVVPNLAELSNGWVLASSASECVKPVRSTGMLRTSVSAPGPPGPKTWSMLAAHVPDWNGLILDTKSCATASVIDSSRKPSSHSSLRSDKAARCREATDDGPLLKASHPRIQMSQQSCCDDRAEGQ